MTTEQTQPTVYTDPIFNVYQIARMGEVSTPDSKDSPGARWLETVARDAYDTLSDIDDAGVTDVDDLSDEIWERADQLVPVYTHNRWEVFVDLAAYQEEVSDYGPIEDLTQAAGVALYMIAERIIRGIWEEHIEYRGEDWGEEE